MPTMMLKRAKMGVQKVGVQYRWDIINQLSQKFYWHQNSRGDRYQVVQKAEINKGSCKKGLSPFFTATVRGWKVKAIFYGKDGKGRFWFYVTRICQSQSQNQNQSQSLKSVDINF